jgi:hypothetical protein
MKFFAALPSLLVLQLINIQWSSSPDVTAGLAGFYCHGFVVLSTPQARRHQVVVLSSAIKTDDDDIDIVEIRADIERLREEASHRLDALNERFKEVETITATTTVPATKMEESLTEIANEFDRDMKELSSSSSYSSSNSNMGLLFSVKKEDNTSDIDGIDDDSSSSKPHHHKVTVDELYPKKEEVSSATKKKSSTEAHRTTVDELYPKKISATKKSTHKVTVDELYPKKVSVRKEKTTTANVVKDQKDTLKLLDDTRWKMMLNVGRVSGTWMPKTWGASGDTLKLQLEIEFTSQELHYERENFLCDSHNDRSSKLLRIIGEKGQIAPTMTEGSSNVRITNGGWKILQQDGPFQTSVLRFYFNVEEQEQVGHVGSDVYLPKGRIYGTCGYFPMTTRSNVDGKGTSRKDACTNELRQLEVKYESLKNEKDNANENDNENDYDENENNNQHHHVSWWSSNNIITSSFHRIKLLHEMMVVREDAERLQHYIENEKIREPSKDKLRLSQDQSVGLTKGKMMIIIIIIIIYIYKYKYKYNPFCKTQQQHNQSSNDLCILQNRPSSVPAVCLSVYVACCSPVQPNPFFLSLPLSISFCSLLPH